MHAADKNEHSGRSAIYAGDARESEAATAEGGTRLLAVLQVLYAANLIVLGQLRAADERIERRVTSPDAAPPAASCARIVPEKRLHFQPESVNPVASGGIGG